jgi:AraC family transcriptional regulator, regulatory protein of adaptative response / DNA-3-methyladenine glycosylase II
MSQPSSSPVPLQPKSFRWQLSYRPPFDWPGMLRFLGARMLKGVEWVRDSEYLRTVRLDGHTGWIRVRLAPTQRALVIDLTRTLAPVLPAVLSRMCHLFDLRARPNVIAGQLMRGMLAEAVARNPGLRVPGAFDGFEPALHAVLGPELTVKAATILAGRLAEAFGEPLETAHPGLTRLSPTPERIAAATRDELTALGIAEARAESLLALARELAAGRLILEAGADPELMLERLTALPGIGRWTGDYIAMRALGWTDAFPYGDVALRNSLGGVSSTRAQELAQAWRPWRSYATVHLWQDWAWHRARRA